MTGGPRPLVSDEGGDPPCWAHLHDDPDDRATVAEPLAREILDQLSDAVIVCDPTGTITYWNPAAADLFGWAAEEATRRSLELIIPERLRSRHWTGWNRALAAGTTEHAGRLLEVPALRRDGTTISIAFTVTLVRHAPDAQIESVVAIARDDTERRSQQQALRHELDQLRASVD